MSKQTHQKCHKTLLSFVTAIFGWLAIADEIRGQQRANQEFNIEIENARYEEGEGPRVAIDEAHNNFHTKDGRYGPFASVLAHDGYRVSSLDEPFSEDSLSEIDILVIANALHPSNQNDWKLPTPSAFTEDEIDQLVEWVHNGGSLFLIADHMPFPGASDDLAKRFGVEMINGFAFETNQQNDQIVRAPTVFLRSEGGVHSHEITDGFQSGPAVDQVTSFTGQAMRVPDDASLLLSFAKQAVVLVPEVAWQFNDSTEQVDGTGLAQGVALEHGDGRVVIFGEAAMFTSQQVGNSGRTNGLLAESAKDNLLLLRNILYWLASD